MESNPEYLKYLINEEIYRVEDPALKSRDDKNENDQSLTREEKMPDEQIINISGKTLILVDSRDQSPHDILNEVFFKKVISAVNLTEDELILINLSDEKDKGNTIEQYRMKDCYMIAFAEELPGAYSKHFGRVKYNMQLMDGARVLWADPLDQIEKDRSLKIKLWEAMKVLYGV